MEEQSIKVGVGIIGTIEKRDENGEIFEIVEVSDGEKTPPKILFRKDLPNVNTENYTNSDRTSIAKKEKD